MSQLSRVALALLAVLSVAVAAVPASATVLTFDGIPAGSLIDPAYGDRVTAATQGGFSYGVTGGFTPNVEVSYGPAGADPENNGAGVYGDLGNNIFRGAGGIGNLAITLVADPGFTVTLGSLDVAAWSGWQPFTLPNVSVLDGANNVLYSQNGVIAPVSGHTHLDFGSVTGQSLTILFDLVALGIAPTVGFSNIAFTQCCQTVVEEQPPVIVVEEQPPVVEQPPLAETPEPSSLVLLGSALAGAGVFARRRRTRR